MKKTIYCLFLILVIISMTACASQTDGLKTPQVLQPTAVSTALFQIIKPDGTRFDVTLDALKTLPLAQVSAEGRVEEGPYLSDILALAGVTEFQEVTLTGSSTCTKVKVIQVEQQASVTSCNSVTPTLASMYMR